MSTSHLYFDGASRGNPGLSGAGVVIKIADTTFEYHKPLGVATNNEAEYLAIIEGLKHMIDLLTSHSGVSKVVVKGDSQLIIKQLQKKWKVRSENLLPLYEKARSLIETLHKKGLSVELSYIPREKNSEADKLANLGTDNN